MSMYNYVIVHVTAFVFVIVSINVIGISCPYRSATQSLGYPGSVRWQHFYAPQLAVNPQLNDSWLSETMLLYEMFGVIT